MRRRGAFSLNWNSNSSALLNTDGRFDIIGFLGYGSWLKKRLPMSQHPSNILFVCLGNICRSPFAQGLFKKLADQKEHKGVHAESAGLIALPGNSATFLAQKVATEYGVDLTEHQAKLVSENLVTGSDLILVMENSHKEALLTDFPMAADKVFLIRHFARFGSRNRGVADPYGFNYDAYRFCFLDIEDAVLGLLAFLSK
jgi:protein-tyrosine-phosphatase